MLPVGGMARLLEFIVKALRYGTRRWVPRPLISCQVAYGKVAIARASTRSFTMNCSTAKSIRSDGNTSEKPSRPPDERNVVTAPDAHRLSSALYRLHPEIIPVIVSPGSASLSYQFFRLPGFRPSPSFLARLERTAA